MEIILYGFIKFNVHASVADALSFSRENFVIIHLAKGFAAKHIWAGVGDRIDVGVNS